MNNDTNAIEAYKDLLQKLTPAQAAGLSAFVDEFCLEPVSASRG